MKAMSCPAIGSASTSSRASQPSHRPVTTSATIIPAAVGTSAGTAGIISGAMPGSSSTVMPIAKPTRSIGGGEASPRPGGNASAAPMRPMTRTKAKAQAGSVARSKFTNRRS